MDIEKALKYCTDNLGILKELVSENNQIDNEQQIIRIITEAGLDEEAIHACAESCDIVAKILDGKINTKLIEQSSEILKKIEEIAEN